MELLSQRPMFSSDPSTKGFDLSSGEKWIYPENYPVREYQFSIVESALYHNTLVCLPTGLGKTFIAAVVMYNFWRWYPQGKIVFLAPTKPLVAQQIHACQDIMGIPNDETIALTGTMDQKKRQSAWAEHRVIFATPQVFQNDLEKSILPSELVKCVVVDEAHKALGRHAYCEAIRLLTEQNQYFRVLGLSATPGAKLDAVQEVVRNLHITHLELRDDTSPDITPYINERKLDIVLVGLGAELERFKDRYITIMDRHVRVLADNNVIRGNTGNISKGRIYMIHKEYGQKGHKGHNHGQIMKTLTILMTMYHAYELMVRHGLRAFHNFYQNHMDKFWLKDEPELMQLLEEINYYLGPFPDVRPLPDGSLPTIPEDIRFGHNKFQKLKDILLRHFESYKDKKEDTRAIVFVEYRDIVNEVYVLLLQSRPLLRPQKFIGQAGQKQRLQKLALEDFRSNKVNILISTSVGEEGLDVGEVDLIVCFDISQVSPIRLVQRMGRTGRKRDGHIILLVTDGKEHQTLKSAMSRRDSLNNKVLQSSGIINALHETSARMVPQEFKPQCSKIHITVLPKSMAVKGKGGTKKTKKLQKRVETATKTKASKTSNLSNSNDQSGQSSLMKFLKRTRDEAEMNVNDDIVTDLTVKEPCVWTTQTTQKSLKHNTTMKLSNVKLLSSDNPAMEFLTLCTMKRSENEQTNIDKIKTNPNLPSYYAKNEMIEVFLNSEIPDLQILDCLKNITHYVVPICENVKNISMMCENSCLPDDDYHPAVYTLPQRSQSSMEDSKFEALLDDSTNDTDITMFDQHEAATHNDFPTTDQVDWAVNENDMKFEDLLDEGSDESMTSWRSFRTKKDAVSDQRGKFEDIMNASSSDSDKTYYSPRKETEVQVEQRSHVEHPLKNSFNIESKDSFEKSLQRPTPREPFEMMLDDESIDLLRDCEPKEKCELSANEPDERHFKITPSVPEAPTSGTPMNYIPIGLETEAEPQFLLDATDSRAFTIVAETREAAMSKPRIFTRSGFEPKVQSQLLAEDRDRPSFSIVTDVKEFCTNDVNRVDRQHRKVIEDRQVAFTGEIQNISDVSPAGMLTISQTLEEIECIHARASSSNEIRVNNVKGQITEALPDRPRDICNWRLSGTSIPETTRETTSCKFNEHVQMNTESDEDIFGTDDLLVDSDFEEQINNIEKSLCTNVNTSDNEASFDASVKGTDIEPDECEILFAKDTPKRVFHNGTPLLGKPSVRELNVTDFDCEDNKRDNLTNSSSAVSSDIGKKIGSNWNGKFGKAGHSRTESFDVQIPIDDLDWDSDTVKDCSSSAAASSGLKKCNVNNDRSTINANNENSPTTKSSVSEDSLDYNDWNNKTVKHTVLPNTRKKKFNNENWNDGEENNSPLLSPKSSVPETIIEDCDWSSDFEAFSTQQKSPENVQEVGINRDSSKSSDKLPNTNAKNFWPSVRLSSGENSTDWISTDRPKVRLALGKKLSKNIRNNLLKKKAPKTPSPLRQDSDLENEFTVSRIETAVSKVTVSDYFAKPSNVIDEATGTDSVKMYNSRRMATGPLCQRKSDINKLSREDLSDFAAPARYTLQQQQLQQKRQHQDQKSSRGVGVGRKKATSLDSDTRKKKKTTHRKDRQRLRVRSEFVDDEAEVSSDEGETSGSSGLDEDLHGFVSYTQHVDDSIDMRAHYLRTTRSPVGPAKFHIRKPKSPNPNLQIYSQAFQPDEPDSYLYDSFCVSENDDDVFEDPETPGEITMLEEIELKLKHKKRKRSVSADVTARRKRKLLVPVSEISSSEDETEKLRQQIQDESFVLRNKCE